MSYKLTHGGQVVRLSDLASIPADPANRDYAAYIAWLAAGNAPLLAEPLPQPSAMERLANTDKLMARIGEDLIDVLLTKNVIKLSDLPAEAQTRFTERKPLRDLARQGK